MNTEEEIIKIKERNKAVEADKAWEVSLTRKLTICIIIYVVVLLYNLLISTKINIYLTSLIPIIGYFFSTLSLPLVRKIWRKKRK